MRKSSIYKIECTVNKKVYIGQSLSVDKRIQEHIRTLRLNKHYNALLQRAWNKYGEENFTFTVIEKVDMDKIDEREVYWINYYRSNKVKTGFNLDGGGSLNKTHHDLTRAKISNIAKSQGRWQGDNHPHTNGKMSEELKRKTIERLNSYWADPEYRKRFKAMRKLNNTIEIAIEATRKPVVQLTLEGEYISEYKSAREASEKTGVQYGHISSCCNGRRKSNGGYIWVFKDNYLAGDYKVKPSQLALNMQMRIAQIDSNNQIINVYEYKDLKNLTEFSTGKIMNCVHGTRKSHRGFRWVEVKE